MGKATSATYGVSEGCWFFEATIVLMDLNGSAKLGWAKSKFIFEKLTEDLKFGVGYGSRTGLKTCTGRKDEYGKTGYSEGDVVGCYLCLKNHHYLNKKVKKQQLVNEIFFDEIINKEMTCLNNESKLVFTINGKLQGIAYRSLPKGIYYPV